MQIKKSNEGGAKEDEGIGNNENKKDTVITKETRTAHITIETWRVWGAVLQIQNTIVKLRLTMIVIWSVCSNGDDRDDL